MLPGGAVYVDMSDVFTHGAAVSKIAQSLGIKQVCKSTCTIYIQCATDEGTLVGNADILQALNHLDAVSSSFIVWLGCTQSCFTSRLQSI